MKSVWEINATYFCPIVGICMTTDEQRTILAKAKIDSSQMSEYRVHEYIVEQLQKKTPLALRVTKFINTKFKNEISGFKSLLVAEWMAYIDLNISIDNLPFIIWLSAVYFDIEEKDNFVLYSKIHMLLHEAIHNQKIIKRSLKNLNLLNNKYEDRNCKLSKLIQEEKKINKTIKKELAFINYKYEKIQKKYRQKKVLKPVMALDRHNTKLKQKVKNSSVLIEELRAENKELKSQNIKLSNDVKLLEYDFNESINKGAFKKCDIACSKNPHAICPKKILLVGGMEHLIAFYGPLIKSKGCDFEYHNGNFKKGEESLKKKIKKSDYILCSVDNNSHAACLAVKKYCKNMNIRFKMLKTFSVSSIRRTMDDILVS